MLERYLIRYFLAVIDQGSFSRAAAQSGVSQPTLSVGIAKLERLLDATLFRRSNQRVELTEAGARFLVFARRIENEFNAARQSMEGQTPERPFRLGLLNTIPGDVIAHSLAPLAGTDSCAALEMLQGSERELIGHLARGRIDVALTLVKRGDPRFVERPLLTECYRLAMPAGHPLATRDVIAAEDLSSYPMIVRRHCEALPHISRHFTDRGVRPNLALRSTNDERILQLIAAGIGLTVMPASYVFQGVARPRLAGFDVRRTIGILFAHHAEHLHVDPPPVLKALIQALDIENADWGRREPVDVHII